MSDRQPPPILKILRKAAAKRARQPVPEAEPPDESPLPAEPEYLEPATVEPPLPPGSAEDREDEAAAADEPPPRPRPAMPRPAQPTPTRIAAHRAYLREPEEIYRQSFATIRAEVALEGLPPELAAVVVRLVHASGMTDIVEDLVFTADLVTKAKAVLALGASILCDSAMVAAGIIKARLPAHNRVICVMDNPALPSLAERLGTTRSAAAVELWGNRILDSVVAIGNAPTALFHLIEMIEAGGPRPAAILAFPVGFVGAVEAKEALIEAELGIPYLTLRGRRGGSALAAAAVNALAAAAAVNAPAADLGDA